MKSEKFWRSRKDCTTWSAQCKSVEELGQRLPHPASHVVPWKVTEDACRTGVTEHSWWGWISPATTSGEASGRVPVWSHSYSPQLHSRSLQPPRPKSHAGCPPAFHSVVCWSGNNLLSIHCMLCNSEYALCSFRSPMQNGLLPHPIRMLVLTVKDFLTQGSPHLKRMSLSWWRHWEMACFQSSLHPFMRWVLHPAEPEDPTQS